MASPVTIIGTRDIRVDRLIAHPGNPNHGDIDTLSESLARFGQYRPIVVRDSTRTILAGHHVWKAAKLRGWTTVRVELVECDDDTATAVMLADNRIAELGPGVDSAELLAVIEDVDLAGTGYTDADIDALIEELSPPDPDDDGDDGEDDDPPPTGPGVRVYCDNAADRDQLVDELVERGYRAIPT